MTRLAVLLRDHGGPLEADLDHFYGIDLLDFWRGDLSARTLANRVLNLPPGAGLWRSTADDDAWSIEAHLIAHAVDELALIAGSTRVLLRPSEQKAQVDEETLAQRRLEERIAAYKARQRLREEA